MSKKCGVYGIYCSADSKWYVGQSTNIAYRWTTHRWNLRRGTHHNHHLQQAYNLYGGPTFELRILELTDEGMLNVREPNWIAYLKSDTPGFGFNLDSGGSIGRRLTDEARARIGLAHVGLKHTEEAKRRIGASHLGDKHSPESRRKMTLSRAGFRHTPEVRAQIAKSCRGQKRTEQTRLRMAEARRKYWADRRAAGLPIAPWLKYHGGK